MWALRTKGSPRSFLLFITVRGHFGGRSSGRVRYPFFFFRKKADSPIDKQSTASGPKRMPLSSPFIVELNSKRESPRTSWRLHVTKCYVSGVDLQGCDQGAIRGQIAQLRGLGRFLVGKRLVQSGRLTTSLAWKGFWLAEKPIQSQRGQCALRWNLQASRCELSSRNSVKIDLGALGKNGIYLRPKRAAGRLRSAARSVAFVDIVFDLNGARE